MRYFQVHVLIISALLALTACGGKSSSDAADDVYVYNGEELSSELVHGRDGFDYLVVIPENKGGFTFDEAMALEKDGWILPKSIGSFEMQDGVVNGLHYEYATPDSDTDSPALEKIIGVPSLLVKPIRHLWNPEFANIIGTGHFWSGTELSADRAVYYSISSTPGGMVMSSVCDSGEPKTNRNRAVLVKRLPTSAPAYSSRASKNPSQSRQVNDYYVVDPSDGLGMVYLNDNHRAYFNSYYWSGDLPTVEELETGGWHVPTAAEINDIAGTSYVFLPGIYDVDPFENMILYVFPPDLNAQYYIRDESGNLALLRPVLNDGNLTLRISSLSSPDVAKVRLIKRSSDSSGSDAPVASAEPITEDREMWAFMGNVSHVTERCMEAEKDINGIHSYATEDLSKCEIAFDATGRVVADPFGNKYIYGPSGEFIKGMTDNSTIRRDSHGRIIEYCVDPSNIDGEDNITYNFSYDSRGRLASVEYSSMGSAWTETYAYNDDAHWPSSSVRTMTYEGEETVSTFNSVYDYTVIDDAGNWLVRTEECQEVTRYSLPDENDVMTERADTTYRYFVNLRDVKYAR